MTSKKVINKTKDSFLQLLNAFSYLNEHNNDILCLFAILSKSIMLAKELTFGNDQIMYWKQKIFFND